MPFELHQCGSIVYTTCSVVITWNKKLKQKLGKREKLIYDIRVREIYKIYSCICWDNISSSTCLYSSAEEYTSSYRMSQETWLLRDDLKIVLDIWYTFCMILETITNKLPYPRNSKCGLPLLTFHYYRRLTIP